MPTFISDEVIEKIKELFGEHLYEEQEAIDDLYGDESHSNNRKPTKR